MRRILQVIISEKQIIQLIKIANAYRFSLIDEQSSPAVANKILALLQAIRNQQSEELKEIT